MKKVILSLSVMLLTGGFAMAQHSDHDGHNHAAPSVKAVSKEMKPATLATAPASTSNLKTDDISFSSEEHDFKTVAEGPNAEYNFVFTNKGKEPLLINQVHASCGCTTPSWPKEPIMPGKTGEIKASFSTSGRPGPFNKTITVLSNAGSKVLTIKGSVEKAPETSVPQNTSMMKTN